ncbi:integrase catalytic domain-containing protein [Trichonephila clavipes]|nr:integrase catalytic domain-containing protein [Trichonephila clavipes]
MIWINPDQRKLQRILWRENMDEPIKTFELSTVTYGTTSAPFLATRTLKQLALDEAGNFPLGSSVVMSDMYIDDVLTGAETLLEAKELKNQLINIFAKGDSSEIKVLGVYWNPKHDCFSFRVKIDLHELNTKRDVLSTIARIYDPLGLLGPVVAKAKIFLQKLWMLKIDWTDLLPDTINREWRQFVESLQVVNDININRCIVVEQPEVIELHGFSDASQSAYGAVVYCKSITSDRKMLVHLIASKSRVAPTKQTTIPRLELCAAVLLAKLVHRVKQALKLNVTNTFLWSDSMIVLSWIRKESYQLKTFVANRIATIQEMTSSEQWCYVATEDNPADFVSRGMDSLKLKTCELWWNGPKFLMSNQYPQRQIPVAVIKDPGRINNIYPGKDSKVRVVEVKTTRGHFPDVIQATEKKIKIQRDSAPIKEISEVSQWQRGLIESTAHARVPRQRESAFTFRREQLESASSTRERSVDICSRLLPLDERLYLAPSASLSFSPILLGIDAYGTGARSHLILVSSSISERKE